jgi:hypothetical protein
MGIGLVVLTAGRSLAGGPTVVLRAAPEADGSWQLQALVTDAAGAPVGGASVHVAVEEPFLGTTNAVIIGSASTDTTGTASIRYVPTWNGAQVLVATTAGSDAANSVPVTLDVSGAQPAIPAAAPTLPVMSAVAGPAAVAVALTVWLILALTLLYAVLGVARPRLGWRRPMPSMKSVAAPDDAS